MFATKISELFSLDGFKCDKAILPKVTFHSVTFGLTNNCSIDMAEASKTTPNSNCINSIGQDIHAKYSTDHEILMIWIVHGFTDGNNEWQKLMSESYIQGYQKPKRDVVVGIVNWTVGSSSKTGIKYRQAAITTQVIGRYMALLNHKIQSTLSDDKIFPKTQKVCVGHSLGSHVCAFMGKTMDNSDFLVSSKLDRIIGNLFQIMFSFYLKKFENTYNNFISSNYSTGSSRTYI